MSRARRLLWVIFITSTITFMGLTVVLLLQGAFWSAVFSAFLGLFLGEKAHEVLDPTRNKRTGDNSIEE